MKKTEAIFLFATTIIFIIAYSIGHEITHAEIAQQHGCETDINYIPSDGAFMSTQITCDTQEQLDNQRTSQDMVDAIGYHLIFVATPLWMIALTQIIMLGRPKK